jgi:hypothetical protein
MPFAAPGRGDPRARGFAVGVQLEQTRLGNRRRLFCILILAWLDHEDGTQHEVCVEGSERKLAA